MLIQSTINVVSLPSPQQVDNLHKSSTLPAKLNHDLQMIDPDVDLTQVSSVYNIWKL